MDPQNTFYRLSSLPVRLLLFLIFGHFLLFHSIAVSEITLVSSAEDAQFFPSVVDDGKGGVIVVWEDYRTGKDWDVYAQRLLNNRTVWQPNGLPLSLKERNQRRLRTVRHGSHAIIAWNDRRHGSSWDIYAQAVNLDGDVLWETDGIPLCTDVADQSTQAILSDGKGGVIVVWEDERKSSEFQDLYIQHINPAGKVKWELDGIPVFPSKSLQSDPVLIADGMNGFYVVWWDVVRYDAWHIMAYRLSFGGEPIWDAPLLITPTDGMQGDPRVVSDGVGGVIVVWQIYEDFINDQFYAQRITADGKKLWEEKGVPICIADGIQKHATIVNDGNEGIIVVWRDERDIFGDLYMQRVRSDGTLAWVKDGKPLCTAGGHQDKPSIIRTGEDQLFVAWLDFRGDFGEESKDAIYCQQINIDGKLLWEEDGVPISTTKGQHSPPVVVGMGNGEWVVVWSNNQRDNGDIYLKWF